MRRQGESARWIIALCLARSQLDAARLSQPTDGVVRASKQRDVCATFVAVVVPTYRSRGPTRIRRCQESAAV
jgi:hypothetical protein